jgi:pyruvate kinase
VETIEKLIKAGVNIFRFNTKHSTPEWHEERIKRVQAVADQLGESIGILLDLQGPEIRLETRDQTTIAVKAGEELTIGLNFQAGIDVIIPHVAVFQLVKVGQELLIDDGFVETEVIKVSPNELTVKVKHDAAIKHRKGVNLPGVDIDFPALIASDIRQLDSNAQNKVDFVGLSFVRSARDIELLRGELTKRQIQAMIVAKIESQPALDRIDEIIEAADAVMVARGDLGVEVPIEQLAYWQQTIIKKSRAANKPVITATQMLESMINNPRPTRAEATDVAHAIYDGTDAIMLSAESASGKYPVRTVEMMARIARFNEPHRVYDTPPLNSPDQTHMLAESAVTLALKASDPPIDAIVVLTETGHAARAIARHRLPLPVIAATDNQKTCETLAISYGVFPVHTTFPHGVFTTPDKVLAALMEKKILQPGNHIIIVHGHHWQEPGNTSALAVITL